MSGYLLDTHVLLWWLADRQRLTAEAREVIRTTRNPVWVSTASVWEMAIKCALGRLRMPGNLPEVLDRNHIALLGIDVRHALAVADLPLHHRDPFDRMIVVQARREGLVVVSRDPWIREYDVETLDA